VEAIGAYEAKTNLSRLLDDVTNQGKTFLITRHGVPVARLEPIRTRSEPPEDVIAQLRQVRIGVTLGDHSIRSLIEDSRR